VIVKLIAITARLPRSRIRTTACNGVTHERYNGSCNWLRDRVRRFVQKARRGVYSPGSGIVDSALSSIAAIPTKSSCKNGRWLLVAIGDCDPRADSKPRLAEFLRFLLFESCLRISVPLTPRVLNGLRVSEFRGLQVSPMSPSMSIRSSFFFFFFYTQEDVACPQRPRRIIRLHPRFTISSAAVVVLSTEEKVTINIGGRILL